MVESNPGLFTAYPRATPASRASGLVQQRPCPRKGTSRGAGEYCERVTGLDGSAIQLTLAASHAYAAPGIYFPALRVTSHRRGDTKTPHARVDNLGRVRVVVT